MGLGASHHNRVLNRASLALSIMWTQLVNYSIIFIVFTAELFLIQFKFIC